MLRNSGLLSTAAGIQPSVSCLWTLRLTQKFYRGRFLALSGFRIFLFGVSVPKITRTTCYLPLLISVHISSPHFPLSFPVSLRSTPLELNPAARSVERIALLNLRCTPWTTVQSTSKLEGGLLSMHAARVAAPSQLHTITTVLVTVHSPKNEQFFWGVLN